MAARPEAAVLLEKAYKHYGTPDKPVLAHLDMTVEKGIIYGLLGPSGCGKTTLLSCIVGRRKLNSGTVWVLGGRPGEKGSGVPGPRIGYMPQDIALVGEFSVRDAIYYFGRIFGMEPEKLQARFEFLSELLELSAPGRLVKTLSGGQQRRVSFAAALVHEPELLILDEPTVGLDPVLREKIWDFLAELARGGTTVIITTHYIDETKQAHKIGLLRDGHLLAEDSPMELMRKLNCDTLEDVFLKLAIRQHEAPRRQSSLTASPDVIPESTIDSRCESREDFTVVTNSTDMLTKIENPKNRTSAKSRYQAVFIKNIQQFSRQPSGLIMSVIFPLVQVVAFLVAIGHDPRDLKVAVVNEEAMSSPYGLDICYNNSITHIFVHEDETCDQYMMSCWFLEEMEKKQLYPVPYSTEQETIAAVNSGKVYVALHFTKNFTDALNQRVYDGDVEDDVVDDSIVNVWMDMSNHQIVYFIKRQVLKAYKNFIKRVMIGCGKSERFAQIPAHFNDPVYGKEDPEMVAFMAPGIIVTIIYFLAAIVTSTLMIGDRLEGVWERSAVAGVKPMEMLNVHIVIQSVVILFQTIEMMVLSWGGYGLPSKGSVLLCGVLIYLQGLSGMCYGFLLSIYCSSYSMAFFLCTGSFYPMILLCGVMWPLEAMPRIVYLVSLSLPFTIPAISLRDIMEKGATLSYPVVYQGFLITIAWIIITLGLCLLKLKLNKD